MIALGADIKTGWCVVVGLEGRGDGAPAVAVRERLELCPAALPRFAYHAAAELDPGPAATLVDDVAAAAASLATDELRRVVDGVAPRDVGAVAVAAGTEPLHDDLAWILAAHMRLHAAEGELYREALVEAAAALAIPVVRFPKGGALGELANELGRDPAALTRTLTGWGKALGPPWRKEHRDAAAAAWLALLRH